eukprot:CAMPEP_0201568204 /NCGR_PEP_ID=MMETSP0190_2-20130828/9148_1 /ASSEMBLY_ACC=CAM_ASM_000263 /TAXON_ID=37353 /ORGANISM="Rosalina sp." /LENGTH=583 /DNA_ID=CAMNT_0047989067 /DNA_START=21 /DNA_END=1772 /DNA_ORIENTATION=+
MSTEKALKMVDDIVKLVDSVEDEKKDGGNNQISIDGEFHVMGLDSSTQSLTIKIFAVSSGKFECIASVSINFDKELGDKYKVKNGVKQNDETHEVTAPTEMFIEALDIALNKLKTENKVDFSKIVCLSGSGQQHGTVYWRTGAIKRLQNLDSKQTLLSNLSGCFAIADGPIWMDSSTTVQCRELEDKIGSPEKVAKISGSRAYERFSGNQIAKIAKKYEGIYSMETERIALVSSFMCSLFIGDYAPIDLSDGSGMNLLDIDKHRWHMGLLASTAHGLRPKLGDKVANSYDVLQKINKYFVERYGFNKDCQVVAFSGDNPCSLAGLMVVEEGDICVSLGTSDTLFAITKTPKPQTEGHVLCSPIHEKKYMILLCYKNGSISRENIKNKYFPNSKDWSDFSKQLFNDKENGGAGNNGRLAFYYDQPEILPTAKAAISRFDENDEAVEEYKDNGLGAQDIRGIVESQFMAMRQHMERFGVENSNKVLATGGASANKEILQVLSDVFGANVYIIDSPDSATKGAALRALHGYQIKKNDGKFISFKDIIDSVGGPSYDLAAEPNKENTEIYTKLLPRRKKLEDKLPRL